MVYDGINDFTEHIKWGILSCLIKDLGFYHFADKAYRMQGLISTTLMDKTWNVWSHFLIQWYGLGWSMDQPFGVRTSLWNGAGIYIDDFGRY